MRKYEALYVFRTDASDKEVEDMHERLKSVIEQFKGVELRFENWGKRKLAYEMKKNAKGVYFYHLFLGDGGMVAEMQRLMRVSDLVLKFQTSVLEHDVVMTEEEIAAIQGKPTRIFEEIQDERVNKDPARETSGWSRRSFDDDDDDDDDRDDDSAEARPAVGGAKPAPVRRESSEERSAE